MLLIAGMAGRPWTCLCQCALLLCRIKLTWIWYKEVDSWQVCWNGKYFFIDIFGKNDGVCVRACVRVCVCACARARARVRVRVCVCACACARVRVRARVCVCVFTFTIIAEVCSCCTEMTKES